ncbi:hypothetical protein [Anaeromyxobacter sp. SG17]|uniref:hypothetical protein n=1 Tax=Anaeromyxobacter sp. SG17 TaxID=2925405 RepID=UPI001F572614|nr:hypothetical protein [Anaeromyxobacter sp. SG17]
MAARTTRRSIDEAIEAAVEAAITRALPSLRRAIDAAVAARAHTQAPAPPRRAARRNVAVAVPRAGAITRWVADHRARRVPTFVIEATGLDTKKKIVARYGENAAFAKGKPLPHVKLAQATAEPAKAERVVKAKPPIVRRAGAPT